MDEVNLHDARLRNLEVDVAARRLDIGLDGFHYGLDGNEVCRRSISLSYLKLQWMRTTNDPSQSLGGPDGYGDLGYDEIELMPDGSLEHRLIFSSGIEVQVRFGEFQFSYQDKT